MAFSMLSTRDRERKPHTYAEVLLAGLAPDGGLFIPAEYPKFTPEELAALKSAPYTEIAFAVKKKLTGGEIPDLILREMVAEAYSEKVFTVEKGQVVPVTEVESGLWIENLSLGPTASFKDMAMQLLGREMQYELSRRKESINILGATSGDTGSAAEAAMKGLSNIKLFMLSPEIGMSDFQKAQMGALSGDNIFNISIRGRFDDCQDLVKAVKQDPEFAALGAVNSINWARISSQVPYYFSGYFQVAKNVGDLIDVTVPSGNFGNMLSAYIAKQMGLPLRRLIVATNENNVLDKLFKSGVYELTPSQITSSPSMDISKASNYERLVFDLLKADAGKVSAYMNEFSKTGKVSLYDYGSSVEEIRELGFESDSSTHANRLETIKHVCDESGVVIDPHSADGVYVARLHKKELPMLCMSTALPVKFEDTVREALGFVPPRPARFAGIESSISGDSFTVMDASADTLKSFIRTRI